MVEATREGPMRNVRGYEVNELTNRGGVEFSVRGMTRPIYFINGYRVASGLYESIWQALGKA